MTKTTPNVSSKRPYIQNVWNNFTANSGKKPKIEKEKNSKPNFRFGKGPEPESVYKSEMDANFIDMVTDSQGWNRKDSTKSLDENMNRSFIPTFDKRSLSIGGFYSTNCSSFNASKETNPPIFNQLRRASTNDWGNLVENAFLEQILDDIKAVELERADKKNSWNWEENFNMSHFTSL